MRELTVEDLVDMKLHEIKETEEVYIMRVVGGWLYFTVIWAQFVPLPEGMKK